MVREYWSILGTKMRKWLFQNGGLKISAFITALVIWFYFFTAREGISFSMGSTRILIVPVEVLQSPSSMLDVQVLPGNVEVVVRGPNEIMAGLGTGDLKVFVDVKGLKRGHYTLPVRIYTLSPVKVVSRMPQTVGVDIIERLFLKSLEEVPSPEPEVQGEEEEAE